MTRGLTYIQSTDFGPSERAHSTIWSCASEYFKKYEKLPELDTLYGLLGTLFANSEGFSDASVQNYIYQFTYNLFSLTLNTSYGIDILQSFIYVRRFRSRIFSWAEKGGVNPRDFKVELDGLRLEMSKASPVTPFSRDISPVAGHMMTGVSFVDLMTGGGPCCGELIGFLAPSGGGKTTIANQIGVEMANLGRKFVIFQFEQSLTSGKYFQGVYSCATGINRNRIKNNFLDDLSCFSAKEKEKIEESKKSLEGNLFFFDMSGIGSSASTGQGGVMELDSVINSLANKGIKIDGFAIDWFLPMADRAYAMAGSKREERKFYQSMMDQLKKLAERHKVFCWVNHQIAPAAAGKRSGLKQTDSAEFKSFSWMCDICFTLTNLDIDGCGLFCVDKNRNGVKSSKFVKLDGPYAKFIGIEDKLEWSPGMNKYTKSEAAVPSEDRVEY